MNNGHVLTGNVGSADLLAQYGRYYAQIAETSSFSSEAATVTRHCLRDRVGHGSIEMVRLRSGLQVARYDVQFDTEHRVAYDFDDDRFELEMCLDGSMRIAEERAGVADLRANAASLTPFCPTRGALFQRPGERYRAVSITGTRASLEPYLGGLGVEGFSALLEVLEQKLGHNAYLGKGAELHGLRRIMSDLFAASVDTKGKAFMLESSVTAALALLVEAAMSVEKDHDLAAHEIEAVNRAAALLWRDRHEAPTVAGIARELSMSTKRLTSGFKTLFGVTPMQYHRSACLERAADLLARSDWTIERIAYEVGYSSASNFVFAFRTRMGRTPAAYRASVNPSGEGCTRGE